MQALSSALEQAHCCGRQSCGPSPRQPAGARAGLPAWGNIQGQGPGGRPFQRCCRDLILHQRHPAGLPAALLGEALPAGYQRRLQGSAIQRRPGFSTPRSPAGPFPQAVPPPPSWTHRSRAHVCAISGAGMGARPAWRRPPVILARCASHRPGLRSMGTSHLSGPQAGKRWQRVQAGWANSFGLQAEHYRHSELPAAAGALPTGTGSPWLFRRRPRLAPRPLRPLRPGQPHPGCRACGPVRRRHHPGERHAGQA